MADEEELPADEELSSDEEELLDDDSDELPKPAETSGSDVLQIIGAILLLIAICVWNNWPTPHVNTVEDDLAAYATTVRRSYCPVAEKERLLNRIESIERRIDDGEKITPARWQRHDAVLRDMFRQGIMPETLPLIERELQKVENDLADGR